MWRLISVKIKDGVAYVLRPLGGGHRRGWIIFGVSLFVLAAAALVYNLIARGMLTG